MTLHAGTNIQCDFPDYLRSLGFCIPEDYVLSDCVVMLEKLEEEFCYAPLSEGWDKPEEFVKVIVQRLLNDHKRLCVYLSNWYLDGTKTFGQLSDLLLWNEKNILFSIADAEGFIQVKDYMELLHKFTGQDSGEIQEALFEREVTAESFWVGDFMMRALPYTPYSRLLQRARKMRQAELDL